MSYKVEQHPAEAHNYGSRYGHTIDMIVIHSPQGTLRGMRAVFAQQGYGASAHYGVGIDGKTVDLYVDESYAAWHAGNADYNRRSIGIEVEAKDINDAIPDFLDPQIDLLADLCADLCRRYRITVNRMFIVGHSEVPCPLQGCKLKWGGAHHHTDPGPRFPWVKLLDGIKARLAQNVA